MAGPRTTIPTQRVLEALLADSQRELYGLEIGTAAGLRSGTVHPILARLEGIGRLASRWEDVEPSAEGRPARRYYRLPADGVLSARAASPAPTDRRPPGFGRKPARNDRATGRSSSPSSPTSGPVSSSATAPGWFP